MRFYKPISKTTLKIDNFEIIPVRDADKFQIMQWRNEQIKILRQGNLLTNEEHSAYFKNVIEPLFSQDEPAQLIVSVLKDGVFIAYGGLVHIDWQKKTAEISFLNATERTENKETFIDDWFNYLLLIIKLAKEYLNFESIYTYAYDLRPNLYLALEKANFKETERIRNGIEIDGVFRDIVIHTYFLHPIHMRFANESDVDKYFTWANDPLVRVHSYHQQTISYDSHVNWFNSKINNKNFVFYFFENDQNEAIGQVRIETNSNETVIGVSIDAQHRGFGYGSKMLRMACRHYAKNHQNDSIIAYIKKVNIASKVIFEKAGFVFDNNIEMNGVESFRYIYHD